MGKNPKIGVWQYHIYRQLNSNIPQHKMKKSNAVIAAALLAVLPAFSARAAVNTMADIVVVVDESGSMGGEHAWIGGMIANLNTNLVAAGVTDAKFALVGYGNGQAGGNNLGRTLTNFTDVAGFQAADNGLVITGSFEDGYSGINYAFNSLSFRNGAALNVILVTDEDRDNGNAALTYATMLQAFTDKAALLNVVVDNGFTSPATGIELGIDSKGNAYVADGAGGYTVSAGGAVGSGSGNTETDYVALALATGGAAWDLNQLRAGGLVAQSFTAAFSDIKVGEIIVQPPSRVPDSGATIVLFLSGLAVLAGLRRRISA